MPNPEMNDTAYRAGRAMRAIAEKQKEAGTGFAKVAAVILLFFVALSVIGSSVAQVEPGYAGVLVDNVNHEVSPVPLPVGWTLKMPWQSVIQMETRIVNDSIQATAATRDLLDVRTAVVANTHLTAESAPHVYQSIGLEYRQRLVFAILSETIKAATAKYDATQLINNRETVKARMTDDAREKLLKYGIYLDEMNIVDFEFPSSYNDIITLKNNVEQAKQKSELELQQIQIEAQKQVVNATADAQARVAAANGTAEAVLTVAKANADATLLQARADAEALRLQKEQLTPELTQLRIAQAYAARWDGRTPTAIFGSGTVPLVQMAQPQVAG